MFRTFNYNFWGTVFDKGLPLMITIGLSPFMTAGDFGRWALFYQFLLILTAVISSPLLGMFSRRFFKDKLDHIVFFQFPLSFLLLLIGIIIYYTVYARFERFSLIEMILILGFLVYEYYATFQRFSAKDKLYLRMSSVRLVLFVIGLSGCFIFDKITYQSLVSCFAVAHIPLLIEIVKKSSFEKKINKSDAKEMLDLSVYGLSSSLLNGFDKLLIVNLGGTLSFLGIYAFFVSLASCTTVLVEVAKKVLTPKMYRDFTEHGSLRSDTQKKIGITLGILFICHFLAPFVLYAILKHFGLINTTFLSIANPYALLTIFSCGLFFLSVYHFVNPFLIFHKKTAYMTLALFISVALFTGIGILLIGPKAGVYEWAWAKGGMLSMGTLITIIFYLIFLKKYGTGKNI